jgi:hypothetical protein
MNEKLRLQVEYLLRERGAIDKIIWRDNRKETYQQVYDYLMSNLDYRISE